MFPFTEFVLILLFRCSCCADANPKDTAHRLPVLSGPPSSPPPSSLLAGKCPRQMFTDNGNPGVLLARDSLLGYPSPQQTNQ